MKQILSAVAIAVLLAVVVFTVVHKRGGSHPGTSPEPDKAIEIPVQEVSADRVVGVDAFMRNFSRLGEEATVEGVVAMVSEEDYAFTLIDTSEWAACGITQCAELILPVQWSGTMPTTESAVRVEGQVQKDKAGKLIFMASTLEAVPIKPPAN